MTIQSKDLTPRSDVERVIYMACVSREFLNALVNHPDLVDRLVEAGMKFSEIEKILLRNLRFDQLTPYRVAFSSISGEEQQRYSAMAKRVLEQHDYKVPALEKPAEAPGWMNHERTRGIRPGH